MKAEDQAQDADDKLVTLTTQLNELRDKLTASERTLKDAEQSNEQKKESITNMKAREASMANELHEARPYMLSLAALRFFAHACV